MIGLDVEPWEIVLGVIAGLVGALGMWLESRRPPNVDVELHERVARLEARVDGLDRRLP